MPNNEDILKQAGFQTPEEVKMTIAQAISAQAFIDMLPDGLYHHEPSNTWYHKRKMISFKEAIKIASEPYTVEKFKIDIERERAKKNPKASTEGLKLDRQARKALEPDPEDKRFKGDAPVISDGLSIARCKHGSYDIHTRTDLQLRGSKHLPEEPPTTRLRNSASCHPIEGLDHG